MAIRKILNESDEILRKHSRTVEKFDDRLHMLIDDLAETMKEANGVGLAAPQVGVLRRVVTIDVGQGVIEMVNPEIVYESAEQIDDAEGCLSSPGEYGLVKRPRKVRAKYHDRNGKVCEIEGEGLLARAICHETDHLNGRLFKDLVSRMLEPEEY
ncbi:peptide deformylase [Oscillospiraceae bacterium LTW-04]|nr:peptide deformylase [Oscillospiraceae bacterium MB24-C1]